MSHSTHSYCEYQTFKPRHLSAIQTISGVIKHTQLMLVTNIKKPRHLSVQVVSPRTHSYCGYQTFTQRHLSSTQTILCVINYTQLMLVTKTLISTSCVTQNTQLLWISNIHTKTPIFNTNNLRCHQAHPVNVSNQHSHKDTYLQYQQFEVSSSTPS